jgi:hypothetical protein
MYDLRQDTLVYTGSFSGVLGKFGVYCFVRSAHCNFKLPGLSVVPANIVGRGRYATIHGSLYNSYKLTTVESLFFDQ